MLTPASLVFCAQVVRLLLLLLVYWLVLIYPWGFRIYSRVIEGIVSVHAHVHRLHCPW